jgi:tRNA A-37 threonylcarbamoyl transferase component Bud32
MEREARVMQHVVAHRYPAPRVEDVTADGVELVMERVDGPTMLDVLSGDPSTARSHAESLAALHRRLHEIPAPGWLDRFLDDQGSIVHLDLHPLNVILSSRGPVLIDWTNARSGAGAADVAMTWLVLAAAELPDAGALSSVRETFLGAFLGHFDLTPVRAALRAVSAWKCEDRNMRPGEIAAIRRLAATVSGTA